MKDYRSLQTIKALKRAKSQVIMSISCAAIAVGLAIVSFTVTFNEDQEPMKQSIQTVQCIGNNGDITTYHIHIPTDVTNKETFIKGFCQSI